VSSIFDRVDPDTLLENTGSGGYSSTDEFLNRNPETGTYDSESERKEKEKYPTPELSDNPYAFPSVSGAAVSVEQSLSKISFVEGTSGQMSSSIAYIRYWSRKGTQQKTSVNYNPVNGSPADPQEALAGNFSAVQSLNVGGNSPVNTNVSGSFQITGENPVAGLVPTNTTYQSQIRQPTPAPATQATPSALSRLGSIFSANPGGAAAPAWANPFSSRPAAPSPDNAVWQFLFNPEELQLSSGPDYNRAETWGVADPANSGQPLSWRSNKNRKLTFGKVLLHGYTFGRRVDSLEKGLQDLFLARDGENGADGPPVLEFVWGQRVFGPCVIQNIQVREKAWDKGLLVNAEVSFDLEQVPEWTINDGFVDVLRPGRQSTVNDPTVVSQTAPGDGSIGDDDKREPPKTAPDTSPQTGLDPTLCNFAVQQSKLFQQFFNRVNNPLTSAAFGNYNSIRKNFFDLKRNLYSGSSEIGKFVDSKLPGGCKNSSFEFTVTNLEKSGGNLAISPEQNAVQFMRACSGDTKSRIDEWQRTSPKCKAQRVAGQQARAVSQINKQCEQIKIGNSCSGVPNLSERTISTCNSGKTVVCVRGTWELKYPRG
jgi:hypothetical protein